MKKIYSLALTLLLVGCSTQNQERSDYLAFSADFYCMTAEAQKMDLSPDDYEEQLEKLKNLFSENGYDYESKEDQEKVEELGVKYDREESFVNDLAEEVRERECATEEQIEFLLNKEKIEEEIFNRMDELEAEDIQS